MKKAILLFTVICTAALFVQGCKIDQNPGLSEGLTISLHSDSPETRSGEAAFEDVIDHFDYFFFRDAEGTQPIAGLHGCVSGSSITLDTQPTGDFAVLRSMTSYVYILANYSGTIDHSADMTLEQILALPVNDKLVKEKKTKVNDITGETEETGEVVFGDYVVMDSYKKTGSEVSYLTRLAPVIYEEERTVDIALSRIAAKLTLTLNIPQSVEGTMSGENWTPSWRDLNIYYVNALNNNATVGAVPVKRASIPEADASQYEYLTYPVKYSVSLLEETATKRAYRSAPVYSYPQTWETGDNGEPYFKVQLPWVSNIRGSAQFYYKVMVPVSYEGGPITLDRNCYYDARVDLTVLDTDNEYVEVEANYTVAPWAECSFEGSVIPTSAKFFDVPERPFSIYSKEVLEIPFSSNSTVKAYFKEISYTHYGASSKNDATYSYPYLFTFAADGEVASITLPNTDSNNRTVLTAARDRNVYSLVVDGKVIRFTHNLNNVFTVRKIVLTIENVEGVSKDVTIYQHPAIEIEKILAKNAFVNGHFARGDEDVHDYNGNYLGTMYGPTKYYDRGKYKFISSEFKENHHYTLDGGGDIDHINLASQGLGNVYSDWAPNVYTGQMFLVKITVSAFNSTNNKYNMLDNGTIPRQESYAIGDPRVEASTIYSASSQSAWNSSHSSSFWLPEYLKSDSKHRVKNTSTGQWEYQDATLEHGEWEEPLKVLVTSQSTDVRNVIAPRFLVSSALNGIHNPGVDFHGSVRRAATYQENGYPAGRWRLPTEAELAFIVDRQRDGSIPELYAFGSTRYLCANESYVELGSEGTTTGIKIYPAGTNGGYVRFVYDLWYWGDDPVADPDCYHPNMHTH